MKCIKHNIIKLINMNFICKIKYKNEIIHTKSEVTEEV